MTLAFGRWDPGRERRAHKSFKVWDMSAASIPLQTALLNDAAISVNRCVWGPDGLMLGVAFSKHIVQIYTLQSNWRTKTALKRSMLMLLELMTLRLLIPKGHILVRLKAMKLLCFQSALTTKKIFSLFSLLPLMER